MIGGLIPLLVLGALVWLGRRALGHRGTTDGGATPPIDLAVTVRRLFLLGLLYVTQVVAIQGIVEVFREVVADDGPSTAATARGLAFLVVGLPIGAVLVWQVDRRLGTDPAERLAPAWSLYLNAALATGLIAAMIPAHQVIRQLLAPAGQRGLALDELVAMVAWGGMWAGNWFGFRRRHGIVGDAHLAIGTVAGLIPLAIGTTGLVHLGLDEAYDRLTGDRFDRSTAVGVWAGLAAVGLLVWAWYWLAHYRRAERTELWWVTVIPIGALAGFVAAVASAALAVYQVAVWFLGDRSGTEVARHFDDLPVAGAILAVGLVSLGYHRSFLRGPGTPDQRNGPTRNDPIRVYDYLLALAALVAALVGVVVLLATAMRTDGGGIANDVIAGLTLIGVGGPLWWRFWAAIGRLVAADRADGGMAAELRTPIRRAYLYSLFGAAGIAALISALSVLTRGFQDLLDGEVDRTTLNDNRVGLAVIAAVVGVAWYHLRVFLDERDDYDGEPISPPPPPPPRPSALSPAMPCRPVVLVAAGPIDRSAEFGDRLGRPVIHWRPAETTAAAGSPATADGERDAAADIDIDTDIDTDIDIDIGELEAALARHPDRDLLVLVDPDGVRVIPLANRVADTADRWVGVPAHRAQQ